VIIKDLEKAGVYASDLGSTMNRKGIVEVSPLLEYLASLPNRTS
jgi:hypothetical protein